MLRRSRRIHWLRLCLALVASGCSTSTSDVVKVENLPGAVDKSLPAESQARQQALVDLFRSLQLAGEFDDLPALFPGISFRESKADFYGEGNILDRWVWDGAPEGDRVAVKLVMLKTGVSAGTVEYQRVYNVVRHGKQFVITRKQ